MIEWLGTEREQRGNPERKEGIEDMRGKWEEGKGMELMDGGEKKKNRKGKGNETRNNKGQAEIHRK